jgi:hypothetical protein
MTLLISPNATVAEFQATFASHLPHLKPAFFYYPSEGDMWSGFMVLNTKTLLGELSDRLPKYSEPFSVSPNMTIADFEQTMLMRYGLSVKIFRKKNGDWVETTDVRHHDLEGQNELGAQTHPPVSELFYEIF